MICVTDPEGGITTTTYDSSGNRQSLTDPNNNTTTWTYDQYDRVKTETNTLGQKKTFEYNSIGQVIKLTKADDGIVGNADDRVIDYIYDPIQHTTTENWRSGSTLTKTLFYRYDAHGHLLDANDGSTTVHFDYEDGKVAYESNTIAPGVVVEYAYHYLDADLASISTLVGATFESKTFDSQIEYSYTPNGQIETIEQSGPNAATKFVKYTYNQSGLTTQIERTEQPPPSGNPPTNTSPVPVATTKIGYRDSQGKKTNRVQSMSHTASNSTLGSGTSLASYSQGWDLGGRLVSMTSTADQAVTYTYDHNDQLKSATYQKLAYADLNFSYDANGNRNGGGNTPGPDNRQASDGVSDFAYDLDGNMTRRTNKTTGAVIEYAWDLRNRLTDVTFKSSASGPITKSVHYTYDALNRRIGKSVDSDGNGTQDQVDWFANRGLRTDRENAGDEVMLRLNACGDVTSRYLHGASVDEILAEENIAANGTRDVLWPLADQQGSVRDIVRVGTNGQATVVDHIMYGPFGEKVAETDTAIAHLYGYTGREYDKETGLQYNRARYYDPKLGRWISQDPMGFDAGDANLYRYVGNHGTYATDPSGLQDYSDARLQQIERLIEISDDERKVLDRYLQNTSIVDRDLAITANNAGRKNNDFKEDHKVLKSLDKRLHSARIERGEQNEPFQYILGRSNLDAGGWTSAALALRGSTVARARPINTVSSPSRGAYLLQTSQIVSKQEGALVGSQLGKLLGTGGNKNVFALGENQAVGLLKPGKNLSQLDIELGMLSKLEELGLPTVNASKITVDGQPAILMDRFALGSKEVVKLKDSQVRTVGKSSLLNARSAADLRAIRKTMVEKNVKIDDLQFLIGSDGKIVIADPLAVHCGTPSKNNLRMIDLLIQAAEKN